MPFIDWPEPHDATLGVPPSRESRNVDDLVIRIDGEATVSFNQVDDSCGQGRQSLTVVVRVGETQVSAGRDDKSRVAATSHFGDRCGCEVEGFPGSEPVTKHALNGNEGEVVVASPDGFSVSVTHNHSSSHDSSPSVGTSTTSSTCGYGDSNTTEGEVLEAARNAEAAAKRAEVAALFAVDAGNIAAWVAAGGRDSKKPRPITKPPYSGGDSGPDEGETSDSTSHRNIETVAVADADEFLRAFDAIERRRDILGGDL